MTALATRNGTPASGASSDGRARATDSDYPSHLRAGRAQGGASARQERRGSVVKASRPDRARTSTGLGGVGGPQGVASRRGDITPGSDSPEDRRGVGSPRLSSSSSEVREYLLSGRLFSGTGTHRPNHPATPHHMHLLWLLDFSPAVTNWSLDAWGKPRSHGARRRSSPLRVEVGSRSAPFTLPSGTGPEDVVMHEATFRPMVETNF
jgi:hypothetical protein